MTPEDGYIFEEEKNDTVNHPFHYQSNAICISCGTPIECIDITRHLGFNVGNAIKYLWRWENKNGVEDLKKAVWYINDAIRELERNMSIGKDGI